MRLYCGHIECKWTHNERLEILYFQMNYSEELWNAMNSAGDVVQRRYNSRTLPEDMYKRVDFYVDIHDTREATLFLLQWQDRLDRDGTV